MSTLAAPISETYTKRFEALLRATKAIGTCSDCDAAADMLLKTLLEVVPFDYLQLVAFETGTETVGWHLLYSNGRRHDVPEANVVLEDTPIAWVHESQRALVTADWRAEARFAKHGEFLNELGIASTCVLPLARGERRLGVLSLGLSRPEVYSEDEVRFLSV